MGTLKIDPRICPKIVLVYLDMSQKMRFGEAVRQEVAKVTPLNLVCSPFHVEIALGRIKKQQIPLRPIRFCGG